MTTKNLSGSQARWAEKLAEFDFTVEYSPGSQNPADAPSRRPDYFSGYQDEMSFMLPTLQNKLARGAFNYADVLGAAPGPNRLNALRVRASCRDEKGH